jgi:hypothetical protein
MGFRRADRWPFQRYSGTINCDDLLQRGLKVSILIDLLAWIG